MRGQPTRGVAVDVPRVLELYQQGLSMIEIGKITGHRHGVISYHLHKSGIEMRDIRIRTTTKVPTSTIIDLYNQGFSTCVIAKKYQMSSQAVYTRLFKAGIKMRSFHEAIKLSYANGTAERRYGEKSWNWKGGISLGKHGYIEITEYGKKYFEHRKVWEQAHGKLPKGWIVHHLNGIKTDNHLDNLFGMPRSTHSPRLIIKPYIQRITQLETIIKQMKNEMQPNFI